MSVGAETEAACSASWGAHLCGETGPFRDLWLRSAPGSVSLGKTHGWVEARAAEPQWLWMRPSCHEPLLRAKQEPQRTCNLDLWTCRGRGP